MGKIRKFSPHIKWSDSEVEVVVNHYHMASWEFLLNALPNRNQSQIENKANSMLLKRFIPPKLSSDEIRKRKADSMRKMRNADVSQARKKQNDYYAKNRESQKAKMREYYAKRFFWGRAMKLRGESRATAFDLACIWKNQRGLCALTGRKLTRTNAHLDHIAPKSKGGGDEKYNLRWLCVQANLAKRELSDAEFVELCNDVMAWLGRRIQMVEDILKQQNDVTATIPQL